MKRIIHSIVSAFLCVVIVLVGLGATLVYKQMHPLEPTAAAAEDGGLPQINVHVEVVRPCVLEDVLPLTGMLIPWEEIQLCAETSGMIEFLAVEEGDSVEAGQELARIDTSRFQVDYDQAMAHKTLAEQERERSAKLQREGIAPPQTLDQAEANARVASAEVSAVTLLLKKSRVYAPFSGIVAERHRKQGEYAETGAHLLHVMQVHKLKAVIGVPERDIRHVRLGDAATLQTDMRPDLTVEGTVSRIAPAADMATRTFRVEASVDNESGLLRPGTTVRAKVVRARFDDAAALPLFAVLSVDSKRFVVLEDNGVARFQTVETGILQGDRIQITSGIQPGDRVIVAGQRDLREGQPVKVIAEVTE